jgi:RNA polymerase sigma-70 factor, ECF subfamily
VRFAYRRLQSVEDAEDVVQDVLVQAWRQREKYRGIECAAPFLFRMTANRSADVLRRRKRAGPPSQDQPGGPAGDPERLRLVEAVLGRLPSRQAEVIRLRVYGELPFESVAAAMGCSVPTVKSRFRYGIQKLRRILKRQGGAR